MKNPAKDFVTGAAGALGGVVKTVTGSKGNVRAEAAQKAAQTRSKQAAKRSETAQRAADTRKANATKRSASAKKAASTRRQRDARVEAMVEATKRD